MSVHYIRYYSTESNRKKTNASARRISAIRGREQGQLKLERHSVERIYLRQRSFDASKPRVAAATSGE